MSTRILPQTILGKWSVALAAAGLLFNVVVMVLVAQGNLWADSVPNWFGLISMLLITASFATGIISIVSNRERAILVYVGMGSLILLFILGEFLFPH
jgi:hypothetical protein